MSFLTQLNRSSYPEVDRLIRSNIFSKSANVDTLLQRPLSEPKDGSRYILVEGYWIASGLEPIPTDHSSEYILTESVRANLRDLARIVSAGYVFISEQEFVVYTYTLLNTGMLSCML